MYRKTTSAETSDNVDGTQAIKYGRMFLINRTLHIIKVHSPGRKKKKLQLSVKTNSDFPKKNILFLSNFDIFKQTNRTNSELVKSFDLAYTLISL